MTKPFTVLIDLDSTVYDLLNPTLAWVNKIYNINLTPADIKNWHWDKDHKVDPYKFWAMEKTFLDLKPFQGARNAIQMVGGWGVRQVFFSTVVTQYGAWEKFSAVDRDFPDVGRKNTLLTGGSKDLARGDMLIDDGPHNLTEFAAIGGLAVLADLYGAPYCQAHGPVTDVMTHWKQYPDIVLEAMDAQKGWSENAG
jgi:5'(3')-deoxyribonucleotidase